MKKCVHKYVPWQKCSKFSGLTCLYNDGVVCDFHYEDFDCKKFNKEYEKEKKEV